MKKRITALALAFVMVLGTTALAVGGSKTISVSPMTLTINGQAVTPQKSDGAPAQVFAYDGATYVPLRYLSELLGIQVDWSAEEAGVARLEGLPNVPGSAAGGWKDGTYTGSANGMGGAVKVAVTVKDGRIAQVEVLEHKETPGISDPALEKLPTAIVEAQSTELDVVSGASLTSRAILEATAKALKGEGEDAITSVEIPFDKPDVIVVGAGIAGLSSAVRAAELGAKVLVLEQAARVGGSGNLAGGSIVGVGTKIEAENALEDAPELLYADFERLGGKGNFNPDVAMTFAQNCGRAVDWLDEVIGVDFGKRTPTYGAYEPLNVPRVHYAVPASGVVEDSSGKGASGYVKALMAKLEEYIAAGNACLLLNTQAVDILLEENVITGVIARDGRGTTTYTAPSVILATGGYGHNESWLKEYNFTNVTTSAPATATGSGYDFARKAGAVFDGMDFCTAYGGSIPVTGFDKSLTINTYTFKDAIWVDLEGKRFADETTADSKVKSDSWTQAKDNVVFSIFPASVKREDNSPLLGGDWTKLEELAQEGKYVFKADSVEALAAMAGIDAAGLSATVAQYNKDCAAGKDSAFGRVNALTPMEGTLYGVYTVPYVLITSGGPRVNASAQMVRADGSAIQGAYLAGEIIGMGNVCGHTTIGGIGHGNCATWGMIAAENACKNAGISVK